MTQTPATRRQQDLLAFIRGYVEFHGVAPSWAEMAVGIGLKSKSAVSMLIEGLVERGHLTRLPNRKRTLRVVEAGEKADQQLAEAWQQGYAAALRDHGLPVTKRPRVGTHSDAVKPGGPPGRGPSGSFLPSSFNRV